MINKILLILCCSLFSFISIAEEIYNVKAVKIAASDKNSSVARNLAIENGQLKAFQILAKRHFPEANTSAINLDSILNTVAGFELSEEKISATNYSAKINVKFSKKHVDDLMKSLGAKFHRADNKEKIEDVNIPKEFTASLPEAVTSPTLITLVVPVVEQAGQTHWFEDENNWLSFWHKKISSHDLKETFILPIGDLEDLSLLNKHILSRNIVELEQLFERYNVNNIALVKLGNLGDAPHHLTLQLNYINKYNSAWQQHNFADLDGDDVKLLFTQASDEILNFTFSNDNEHLIKKGTKLNLTRSNSIVVEYDTDNFTNWVYLENVMSNSNYIENFELQTMNLNKYQFSFTYKISFIDLQSWLQSHKFNLQDIGDNKFTLTRDAPSAEY